MQPIKPKELQDGDPLLDDNEPINIEFASSDDNEPVNIDSIVSLTPSSISSIKESDKERIRQRKKFNTKKL